MQRGVASQGDGKAQKASPAQSTRLSCEDFILLKEAVVEKGQTVGGFATTTPSDAFKVVRG